MAPARGFGARPRDKVFVRIQSMIGPRVITTVSFNVFGYKHEDVTAVVEQALARKFGDAHPEDNPDGIEKDDPEEPKALKGKKKVKRLHR